VTEKQTIKTSEWDNFWKKRDKNPLGRFISWVRKRFVTTALVRYICSNTEKGVLIEAGCGSGEVTLQVAKKRGDKVILVDRSPEALALAKRKAEKYNLDLELLQCDIVELSKYISPAPGNIVYNVGVVEHFEDCSAVLKEMAKVSGSYAIAIIPQKSLFWKIFISFSRFMKLTPKDFVIYLYDRNTFKALIEAAGMQMYWAKGIRIFGIIPYLGICFHFAHSNQEQSYE
jgi:ubiquinone/menaquinone biosynthesis C-methylase UbiE